MGVIVNINSIRENTKRKSIEKQDKNIINIRECINQGLWCEHCGALIGVKNQETGDYIVDGNYCKYCGKKINT